MKERMERFLRSIKIDDIEDFDMDFTNITKSNFDRNYFIYDIRKSSPWTYHLLEIFINALSNINSYKYEITFTYEAKPTFDDIKTLISDFIFNRKFDSSCYEVNSDSAYISIKFLDDKENQNKEIYRDLVALLNFVNYNSPIKLIVNNTKEAEYFVAEEVSYENYDNFQNGNNFNGEDEEEFVERKSLDEEFDTIKKEPEEEAIKRLQDNYDKMIEDRKFKALFKRDGDYTTFERIADLTDNSGAVDVLGIVFEAKISNTKNGRKFVKFGITDHTGGIYVSGFESNSITEELMKKIEVGSYFRVLGKVGYDKFRKDRFILAHQIYELPKKITREDNAAEKRVELHLHTNMSTLDGLSPIEDYIKLAKNMGHKAIGITDHACIQSYPNAYNAAKKAGIKVLYGCEFYMLDRYLKGCLNPDNTLLSQGEYVVFDLETTGLSIIEDRITEIGAIKYVNGVEVDNLSILINPEKKIPKYIEEKTHISNEMVEKERPIRDVLPQILDFIKGTILVSHNIEFDYLMLNQALLDNGYEGLTQPGVDTLQISRYLWPSARSHSLEGLSKRLEVSYDTKSAHRAVYDAKVLTSCFSDLLNLLTKQNPKFTLNDLAKLPFDDALFNHARNLNRHVVIYAKNQQGLFNLYKLISISHTSHQGTYPFVFRDEIEVYRKDFLIGSACANGEVFYSAYRRNAQSLKDAVSFYDYIEIQPLENYSFLVNSHEIPSMDLVKRYLLAIIEEAKRQNKLIVATGDCHYTNSEFKRYRDILIESEGVGKVLHPLAHASKNSNYYANPDQHFRDTVDMLECFKWLGEKEAEEYVIKNSNFIADQIEELSPIPPGLFPPKIDNVDKMLRDLCFSKAHELYGEKLPELIENRLETELQGIINNGYAVIYYISHLLVKMSNDRGYIVGSRGSVGSSFAATMASITEVNPLPPHYRCPKCKYVEFSKDKEITSGFDLEEKVCPHCGTKLVGDGQSIPFQTFLGFHAEKTPDIDLNFPADFQSTAHNFTKELLGENNVYRAGTVSTVKIKTAIGYVRKYYEKFGQDWTKMRSADIAALAFGCTDVKRTTGQHPGGIVVIPNGYDINYFTPIQYPAEDVEATWRTTHFDYDALHETILKFDMLGHVDPQAVKMMTDLTGVDGRKIPMNDKKVISLFSSDKELKLAHKYMKPDNGALGLPEFGTNFVRQMLRETNPKSFSDLLIISGLSHGTEVWANNQQNLIQQGITNLRGLIGCRDDIMEYLIRQGLPNETSFKIMEIVRKNKPLTDDLIALMREHNVPDYYIESCKKIAYLFPKGHACAYVMMAMRVGYYKLYHPLEYYATYFTLRCDSYDIKSMIGGIDAVYNKLQELDARRVSKDPTQKLSNKEESIYGMLVVALEMLERGYTFGNIDIEKSDPAKFIVDKENKRLICPFKVLDGLGETSCEQLIVARKEREFSSFDDFKKRAKLSSTVLDTLKQLGVFANMKENDDISLFDFDF